MVLEKTLESPLDCKEIQPVHSEGDQPWDSLEGQTLWAPTGATAPFAQVRSVRLLGRLYQGFCPRRPCGLAVETQTSVPKAARDTRAFPRRWVCACVYRDAPMGLSGPSPQQEPHRSGLHLLGGGSQSFLQTNSSEEGREKAASSLPGPQKRISGWKHWLQRI